MQNTHNKIKTLKQYENADANNVCEFGLDLFYNFEKSCDENNIHDNFEKELSNLQQDAENFLEVIARYFQGKKNPLIKEGFLGEIVSLFNLHTLCHNKIEFYTSFRTYQDLYSIQNSIQMLLLLN